MKCLKNTIKHNNPVNQNPKLKANNGRTSVMNLFGRESNGIQILQFNQIKQVMTTVAHNYIKKAIGKKILDVKKQRA